MAKKKAAAAQTSYAFVPVGLPRRECARGLLYLAFLMSLIALVAALGCFFRGFHDRPFPVPEMPSGPRWAHAAHEWRDTGVNAAHNCERYDPAKIKAIVIALDNLSREPIRWRIGCSDTWEYKTEEGK